MQSLKRFNVRVYGLLVAAEQVLLSHENLRGVAFTKFPGGGLKLGEAPSDGLKREFHEELGLSVTIEQLLHVPDFVVVNQFQPGEQVLVLHYLVKASNPLSLDDLELGYKDLESLSEPNRIEHSWEPLQTLAPEQLTFPADKEAAQVLKDSFHM